MNAAVALTVAAAAGAGADLLGARISAQRSTVRTVATAVAVAMAVAAAMAGHSAHSWHARIMPLWAWGWLVVADVDVRTRVVYRSHIAALSALALLASILDHQTLVSLAGATVVSGILAGINIAGNSPTGHLWPATCLGALLGTAAWITMWRLTSLVPLTGITDSRVQIAAFVACMPPLVVLMIHQIASRARANGWDGELVGWGDVMLVGVMGLWFGLRWVWTPLLAGACTAMALGLIQWVAIAWAEDRAPWLREGHPTVPALFAGAVIMPILVGH